MWEEICKYAFYKCEYNKHINVVQINCMYDVRYESLLFLFLIWSDYEVSIEYLLSKPFIFGQFIFIYRIAVGHTRISNAKNCNE